MMSVMWPSTVLPFLLSLPMLPAVAAWRWQAGLAWADGPEAGEEAHQHADYAAPVVTLAGPAVCNSSVNRTYVLARFEGVGASGGYRQQVGWGHDPDLSVGDIPWGLVTRNTRIGPKPWGLRLNQEPEVGKGYSLRIRALDVDGNHGPWGEATCVYSEGTAAAPADVVVSADDGDYSRAALSWRDGQRRVPAGAESVAPSWTAALSAAVGNARKTGVRHRKAVSR